MMIEVCLGLPQSGIVPLIGHVCLLPNPFEFFSSQSPYNLTAYNPTILDIVDVFKQATTESLTLHKVYTNRIQQEHQRTEL